MSKRKNGKSRRAFKRKYNIATSVPWAQAWSINYVGEPLEEAFQKWRQEEKMKEQVKQQVKVNSDVVVIDEIQTTSGTFWYDTVMFPGINFGTLNAQQPKQEEATMSATDTNDFEARRALRDRIYTHRYEKLNELRKAFFITINEPEDAIEMIQRIKDGAYTLDEKEIQQAKDEDSYVGLWTGFSWRTKDTRPDHKGFTAAVKALNEAYEDAKLELTVLEPEKGLKVVKKFAETDFSK